MKEKVIQEIMARFNPAFPVVEFEFDEKLHRTDFKRRGDKSIWMIGKEWIYKGNTQYSATIGNWNGGDQFTVKSWIDGEIDKSFIKARDKALEETRLKVEIAREQEFKEMLKKWVTKYKQAREDDPVHQYLKGKRISENFSARVNGNTLLVPAYDQNGFSGVQMIFWQEEEKKFVKYFAKGSKKKGSFHPIGSGWKEAKVLYVAEGFATAASIHMATGIQVICLWDCGNLVEGIQTVRHFNPSCNIVICADDDKNKDPKFHKIGERKAKYAASKFSNVVVRVVRFSQNSDDLTDFNDLHVAEGIEAVADQLQIDTSDFCEVICLGHQDKKNYFFSTQTNELYPLSAAEHNKTQLMMMAPSKYWGDNFGYKYDKEGNETDAPDWDRVVEGLAKRQAGHGFFNPKMVRGYGSWLDKDKLVINVGNRLIYDGEYRPIFNHGINTRCFYEANQSLSLGIDDPMTDEEAQDVIEAFKLLEYKKPNDFIYLVGWIANAQVFAAMDWRPHIHITGPRGCGKSTILNYTHEMIPMSWNTQDSSAAGVRQTIKNNATPIIFDESEADDDKMKAIYAMARQASSRLDSTVARGTTSGKAQHFNATATFCMGSIQRARLNSADESRFFVIEMNDLTEQTESKKSQIKKAMAKITKISKKLFARANKNFNTTRANVEIIKTRLQEKSIESRQADQLAHILAGYYMLESTDTIEDYEVDNLVSKLDFFNSDYVEENRSSESEKCLNTILELPLPNKNISVETAIHNIKYELRYYDDLSDELKFYGIKFNKDDDTLFVSAKNSQLKEKILKFSSYEDYIALLKRHECFIKYGNCWIFRSVKGVFLKYLPK